MLLFICGTSLSLSSLTVSWHYLSCLNLPYLILNLFSFNLGVHFSGLIFGHDLILLNVKILQHCRTHDFFVLESHRTNDSELQDANYWWWQYWRTLEQRSARYERAIKKLHGIFSFHKYAIRTNIDSQIPLRRTFKEVRGVFKA